MISEGVHILARGFILCYVEGFIIVGVYRAGGGSTWSAPSISHQGAAVGNAEKHRARTAK